VGVVFDSVPSNVRGGGDAFVSILWQFDDQIGPQAAWGLREQLWNP
jgi:hypothetical protein